MNTLSLLYNIALILKYAFVTDNKRLKVSDHESLYYNFNKSEIVGTFYSICLVDAI